VTEAKAARPPYKCHLENIRKFTQSDHAITRLCGYSRKAPWDNSSSR